MNEIQTIKTTGKNLLPFLIGNGKTAVNPQKIGALVAGAVATAGAKIYLETADNKATLNVEQGDVKQSADFVYNDNGDLTSARSIYSDKSKDEVHSFDDAKAHSEIIHHTIPLTEDTKKNIETINSAMAQTVGYKSGNTDFNSGDVMQMSSATAQKKFPEILKMILSLMPNFNTKGAPLKINIQDKFRDRDGVSILGFSTQDKNIKGLISSSENGLTYHVDTPDMTIIGETSKDNESYSVYMNNETVSEVTQNADETKVQNTDSKTVNTQEETPATIEMTRNTKIQEVADFIRESIEDKDMTATEIYKASKYDLKLMKEGYKAAGILNATDGQKVLKMLQEGKSTDEIISVMKEEGIDVTKEEIDFVRKNQDKRIYQNHRGKKTLTTQTEDIKTPDDTSAAKGTTTDTNTQGTGKIDNPQKHSPISIELRANFRKELLQDPNNIDVLRQKYYQILVQKGITNFDEIKYILGITSKKALKQTVDNLQQADIERKQKEAGEKLETKRNTTPVYTLEEYENKVADILLSKNETVVKQYETVLAQAYLDGYNIESLKNILDKAIKYLQIEHPDIQFSSDAISEHCNNATELAANDSMQAPTIQDKKENYIKTLKEKSKDAIVQSLISIYDELSIEPNSDEIGGYKKNLYDMLVTYQNENFDKNSALQVLEELRTRKNETIQFACEYIIEDINAQIISEYKSSIEGLLSKIPNSDYKTKEDFNTRLYTDKLTKEDLQQLEKDIKAFLYTEQTSDIVEDNAPEELPYTPFEQLHSANKKAVAEILSGKKVQSISLSYSEVTNLLQDIGFVQTKEKFTLPNGHFATRHTSDTNHIIIQKEGNQIDPGAIGEVQKICQQFYNKDIK